MIAPAPVLEESSPRDVKIAIARQAIESCLLEDDQLADGHRTPFEESTVVVFTVGCPDWERGMEIEASVRKALADQRLDAWAKRSICRELGTDNSAIAVEIRVVVGTMSP